MIFQHKPSRDVLRPALLVATMLQGLSIVLNASAVMLFMLVERWHRQTLSVICHVAEILPRYVVPETE
jgi:hypothetical protein